MATQQNGRWGEEPKSSPTTNNGFVSGYETARHEEVVNGSVGTTAPHHTVTVTLTDEDLTLLEQVGEGSYSEGIRLALRAWRRESAARLTVAVRIATEIQTDPASLVSHEELQRRLAEKNPLSHVVAP